MTIFPEKPAMSQKVKGKWVPLPFTIGNPHLQAILRRVLQIWEESGGYWPLSLGSQHYRL